jgi:hypothetical protein
VNLCKRAIFFVLFVLITSLIAHRAGRLLKAEAKMMRRDTVKLGSSSTDIIRTFEGKEVLCEEYFVKKGDSIWEILHERIQGSVNQIIHWSKVLQTFNPQVLDTNLIHPGQRLLVPLGFLKRRIEPESVSSSRELSTTIYEVETGENLSGILNHRFHFPEHLVFNEAINKVRELNPQIKDLNRIRPGQRLVIPLSPFTKSPDTVGSTRVREGEPAVTPVATLEPVTPLAPEESRGEPASDQVAGSTQASFEDRLLQEGGVGSVIDEGRTDPFPTRSLASPVKPGLKQLQVLADAVVATVVALGGRGLTKGVYSLPLGGQGEISLKSSQFPLLEFPSGERFFLDLNDHLPAALEEAIHVKWKGGYRIVNVEETDTFRSIWQRVIDQLTGMKVSNDRDPLLISEPLKISIRGDWILTPSHTQLHGRKIYVVNLLKDAGRRTDPALRTYLDGLGIRVVDVELRGQLEQARIVVPMDEKAFNNGEPPVVVHSISVPDLVEAFLKLLGQACQRDARVLIDTEVDRGFTVSVRAGFYFQRNGNHHMIDFGRLSPSILHFLEKSRFKVLVVEPDWKTNQVFETMMKYLSLNANSSYNFSASTREPMRNIHLSIPGDLIRDGKQSYLLTPLPVSASLKDFFRRKGVRVLSYQSR